MRQNRLAALMCAAVVVFGMSLASPTIAQMVPSEHRTAVRGVFRELASTWCNQEASQDVEFQEAILRLGQLVEQTREMRFRASGISAEGRRLSELESELFQIRSIVQTAKAKTDTTLTTYRGLCSVLQRW